MTVESAVPPVRFAEPLDTVIQASEILEVSSPPTIFVCPVTFPPVRSVVPLDVRSISDPPVRFKVPLV